MKLFQVYYFLIFLSLKATIKASRFAKPGCKDMCGEVRIPYPFGIGANCSINEWYIVDCNSSKPYLPALNHLEVVGADLGEQTVTVNMPIITDCWNSSLNTSVDLGRSPFLISKLHNKFVVEGCGNIAVMMDRGSVVTGCSTTCHNDTLSDSNNCIGISCCQNTIPHYLKSYSITHTGLEIHQGDRLCLSAFVVDDNIYSKGRFWSQFVSEDRSYVPVSLLWTVTELSINCGFWLSNLTLDLGNGTTTKSWKCELPTYLSYDDVNAYFPHDYNSSEECRRCMSNGGYCDYTKVFDVDHVVLTYRWEFSCFRDQSNRSHRKLSLGAILGITISMGVLFLVATGYILYKVIGKLKVRQRRKMFFERNGGLLLKQLKEADQSMVDNTIHFSSRELEKATDKFNENRILGRGGQGTVYKLMLADGRIVAVKKSKIVDKSQLQQFINEVVILSQVNHRNVVKLLGCCLESDVPLLVSEFISNGTLFDHIHNEIDGFRMSLNRRLQIATEVAGAVGYLHSETSIPIFHKDIKTTNILLDDRYTAKVSDFGTSRFVALDQSHLTTLVQGTCGYLDPEYFQTSHFTEKSDVYSFGVVLVELLTGKRPIFLTELGENRNLASFFILAMEEDRVMSIFDELVINEGTGDELMLVANLALRCLNLNGSNRPTMKQVAAELESIRMSHVPSVQTPIGRVVHGEISSTLTIGESSSSRQHS